MSAGAVWALLVLGFAIVVVRRRTLGIGLLAAQSLVLGAVALREAGGDGGELVLAGIVLAVRGVLLPAGLLRAVRVTPESRRVASERFALPRLVAAAAAVAAGAALVPPGIVDAGTARAAVALLVLGIAIAALRRAVVFQAIGFLVAENGVYLACVAIDGGIPGAIELALLFDLVAVLAVAAAFGERIHAHFGTGDTELLKGLHD